MLKQKKDGSWLIESGKDLDAAIEAVEDRLAAIAALEQTMEEQYDYLTMKQEVVDLHETIRVFMLEHDQKHIFRDTYKLTLIRRTNSRWNPDKLKALVSKPIWLRITKAVVDADKIHDLVTQGKLSDRQISPALESTPSKPYLQRFDYKKGQDKDAAMAEENSLREAMRTETVKKSKGGRK